MLYRDRRERVLLAYCGWSSAKDTESELWIHPQTGEHHEREEAVEMVFSAIKRIGTAFASAYEWYEDTEVADFRRELDEYGSSGEGEG